MSGALDMAEQVATSFANQTCHGTTSMVKNPTSSSLDADSLLRLISHTVDHALDGLAETCALDKKKAKALSACTYGQESGEDSLESRPSAELARFPTEILLFIAENCDKKTLWSLCLTARVFVQPASLHLYRDVDLSTHNRGLVRNASGCGNIMARSDCLLCRRFPPAILQRQEAFIRSLYLHPEYKLYVHNLRWTILPFGNNLTGGYSEHDVWTFIGTSCLVLGSLTNLREFDLCDLSQPHPEIVSIGTDGSPRVHMPHLRRLDLGGCIHPTVGAPLLLHQDLAKLTHLHLNNVFMQRPLHTYLDKIVMKHLEGSLITASSDYDVQEGGRLIIHWDTYAQHGRELLGIYEKLIRSNIYLVSLLRCRSLKVLTFETHGVSCMGEYPGPLPAYLNAFGYMLCGMILQRNTQTLTHFTFRHGTDNSPFHASLDPAMAILVGRNISWRDYMFRSYIYTSICCSKWPSMESVVLTGIDSWGKPGKPGCPRQFSPIPAPRSIALDITDAMFQAFITRGMTPKVRLLCLSETRLFDPFEISPARPTEPSTDGEEEEEEEEEEGSEVEPDNGADDDEGWETDTDEGAIVEGDEADDDSDSVEEIGQEEFERSQELSPEEKLFDQFCTVLS